MENQPYDLAVDVNDSEEIESDEEDDEATIGELFMLRKNGSASSWSQDAFWQPVRDCGDPVFPF